MIEITTSNSTKVKAPSLVFKAIHLFLLSLCILILYHLATPLAIKYSPLLHAYP